MPRARCIYKEEMLDRYRDPAPKLAKNSKNDAKIGKKSKKIDKTDPSFKEPDVMKFIFQFVFRGFLKKAYLT